MHLRSNLSSVLLVVVASTWATPLLGQVEAAPERPLSLAEAVIRALETNEEILIERTSVALAAASESGARGAYDPLLAVETGWSEASTPVNSAFSGASAGALAPSQQATRAAATLRRLLSTGGELSIRSAIARTTSDASFDLLSPAWDSQLGFELRQPLLRDRRIDGARAGLRVAAADRRLAAAGFRQVVIETVAAVERAYWSLAAARSAIAVREEALWLAEEQLEETVLRIDSGALPESEEAQPRAELERRRGELLAARESAQRAESALRLLILADGDDAMWAARLVPIDEIAVQHAAVEVAQAMQRALASRVELEAAKSLIERRVIEGELAGNGIDPSLDLVVSYDRFGLSGARSPFAQGFPGLPSGVPEGLEGGLDDSLAAIVDGEFDDARIGLFLELPIGRTSARAEAEITAQARRRAEAELTRARKAVRVEVLDAAAALETAAGRIDAARAGRQAAEVQLAAERERYAVGLSTNFLVLTRQNDLAGARLDEIGALTDYRTADTDLRRATGSLLDDRSIDVRETDEGLPR